MEESSNPEGIERLEAGLESLSDLSSSLRSQRFIGSALGVSAPASPIGRRLADLFVHVAAKALLEHEAFRTALFAFMGDGLAEDYHRAQDHAESCVNALHRAVEVLDRMRARGFRLPDGRPYIPRGRDFAVLAEQNRKKIRDFRDALEHIDKDIVGGNLSDSSPVVLAPRWDRLHVGKRELLYVDIAETIRQIHRFAVDLSTITLVVADPPDSSVSIQSSPVDG